MCKIIMDIIRYDYEESPLGIYGYNFKHVGKYIKFPRLIRGLKSIRNGRYYLDCNIEWEYEPNSKIVNYDNFGLLSIYIQFFADCCEITDEFIKKHDVKKYHISLIKRMHFDYNNQDNLVNLGYKRPYGNSGIEYDIAEEYLRFVDIDYDEYFKDRSDIIVSEWDESELQDMWVDENEQFLLDIHSRVLDIFDAALEELDMPLHFENNSGDVFRNNWIISNMWLRKKKIEKLLGN